MAGIYSAHDLAKLKVDTEGGSDTGIISETVLNHGSVIKDSLSMVIFIGVTNLFNYLYQLTMGILLPQALYSVFFSLTSLLVVIMVFSQTLTVAIAKHISSLQAREQAKSVNFFWKTSLKNSLLWGMVIFVISIALSPLVTNLLKLNNIIYPVIVFSSLPFLFLLSVNWGVLQGMQRFFHFGFSQAITAALKVVIAALMVYLGYGIYGGLTAIPVSFALALLISFAPLRNLPATEQQESPKVHLYAYSLLTLLAMLAITMLANIDVILARNFFPPDDASNYSAISVLGRVAFYAPIGITAAMFPKASILYESSGRHERLFLKAMVLVLCITGAVVLIYGLFPNTINNFIFGSKYPVVSVYLFSYGLTMALFGFSFFLMSYLLSLNQTRVAFLLCGIAFVQLILLSLFHTNIALMINIMLSCGTICVISLTLYIITTALRRKINGYRQDERSH